MAQSGDVDADAHDGQQLPLLPTRTHLRPLPTNTSTTRRPTRSVGSNAALGRVAASEALDQWRRPSRDDDLLTPYRPAILAVRWATTMVSVTLALGAFASADLSVVPWVGVVVCNTAFRTLSPLRYVATARGLIPLLFEVGLHVLVLAATGYWASPLVFSLVNAIIIGGFARGFGFGVRIAAASAIAVSLPTLDAAGWTSDAWTVSAQWTVVLLLVGVVAGYGRRISGEATRQTTLALDRLTQLADANALLFNLHRVAQTLPASLDLEEVLETTIVRIRNLFFNDGAVIFTVEESDGSWIVAKRAGLPVPHHVSLGDLPPAVRSAVLLRQVVLLDAGRDEFFETDGQFLRPSSRSGLYAPLTARGSLVGLVAIEHREPSRFDERDREVLASFVDPVALAIDNARWFARLRTVGADEERTRIARDLHDRIGQSLAYLGFELDRVVRRHEAEDDVGDDLRALRSDLRDVVSEVRDTLYDLRTDVDESREFAVVVAEFAGRLGERGGFEVHLDCDEGSRLPILQEREMWRIAQEALVNVERHAQASRASVTWRCDGNQAVLEVTDNGRGFSASAGRVDSYGVLGMRERASSIGATFDLTSSPGEGTTVRCSLEQD
jgi:signal transduction histidine kinase